ncbi:MAG: calcium-binding protein [Janthinobacterium lividum]
MNGAQLNVYQDMLRGGHVEKFYAALSAQGYQYAGWAVGVYRGDTVTGASALGYLSSSAVMGIGIEACKNLSQSQVDSVRKDMAQGYLNALLKIAEDSGGVVNRDVKFEETYAFHEKAFQKNNLSIDNWTLKTPFDLITQQLGQDAAEARWEKLRDTGGEGWDALMESAGLMKSMGDYAFKSPDATVRARALAWIDIAPGTANFDALLRTLGALGTALRNNSLPWLNEHYLDAFTTNLQSVFNQARVAASPLILDLDGDGVETIGQTYDVHFDHDGDGLAERTGWASKDDGLLVRDLDGNGTIDDGGELFGSNTLLANGQKAANGFEALRGLDGNNDGKISSADAVFSQLRIWKDANQDGITQDGELFTLAEAGVASIGTAYTNQSVTDANGNQHLQAGSFTTTTGLTRKVDDVWFGQDTARTVEVDAVAETDAIKALPELAGMGRVHSLHQTLARAPNPALEGLLSRFASTTDEATLRQLTTSIIYQWTGVQNASPTSRGAYLGDARMLLALEAVLGTDFVQRSGTNAGTADPGPNAAAAVVQSFDLLQSQVFGQLLLQTQYAAVLDGAGLTVDAVGVRLNTDTVVSRLRAGYDQRAQAAAVSGQPTPASNAEAWVQKFFAVLPALGEAGVSMSLQLAASGNLRAPGFEHALAAMGLNAITGDAQANVLNGTVGGDLLDGGAGNDTLSGGAGNDTYLFDKGYGLDTIKDQDSTAGNSDTLRLGAGLAVDAAVMSRTANDLVLGWGSDAVTVQKYFGSSDYRVENIQTSDGRTWHYGDIADAVTYNGSANSEVLNGLSDQTNRINGLAGNDTITGGNLDDVLHGGEGNDTLGGSLGNDTYVFDKGDGVDVVSEYDTTVGNSDTLRLGEGLSVSAASMSRSGNSLTLTWGTDAVTVQNYFLSTAYRVEDIVSGDGTAWGYADIANTVVYNGTANADMLTGISGQTNHIDGFAGNDTITGSSLDDFLYGGEGDDTVNGGAGADFLVGGAGNDVLNGGTGTDTYSFGRGSGLDTLSRRAMANRCSTARCRTWCRPWPASPRRLPVRPRCLPTIRPASIASSRPTGTDRTVAPPQRIHTA